MSGNLNMRSNHINSLAELIEEQDVTSKNNVVDGIDKITGCTVTGQLNMGGNKIIIKSGIGPEYEVAHYKYVLDRTENKLLLNCGFMSGNMGGNKVTELALPND